MTAAASPLRGIRFPGRYIQGPGALDTLGSHTKTLGTHPLVLIDRGVFDLLETKVRAALAGTATVSLMRHGGECSEGEVASLVATAVENGCDLIVGIGGGKALDTAKAAAFRLRLPVVVVPTIAASDAPCSALAVIYNPDGTVAHDLFLPRNPDLVLVDTALIAAAPARFLAAGIGDALATFYEAEACRLSGARNCMGLPGIDLAYAIAARCRDRIMDKGAKALAECDEGRAGPAMEVIVEANILLSGIGFESGGVAAAHAIHHGLCELDEVHSYLHGEKVAIGVLVGLLLAGEQEEYQRIRDFCLSVRLPTRLADIGLAQPAEEQLIAVARRATRAGEIIHNEPRPVTAEMVLDALRQVA